MTRGNPFAFMKPVRTNRTRNKYGIARKQLHEGGRYYGSQAEADYRKVLDLLVAAGKIKELVDQPQVYLTDAQIGYRPDFCYFDLASRETIFVEVKGLETREYQLKLKLWRVYGPGPLLIVKRKHSGDMPSVVERVVPKCYQKG